MIQLYTNDIFFQLLLQLLVSLQQETDHFGLLAILFQNTGKSIATPIMWDYYSYPFSSSFRDWWAFFMWRDKSHFRLYFLSQNGQWKSASCEWDNICFFKFERLKNLDRTQNEHLLHPTIAESAHILLLSWVCLCMIVEGWSRFKSAFTPFKWTFVWKFTSMLQFVPFTISRNENNILRHTMLC